VYELAANNLLTAADLAGQKPGSTVTMPRGSIVTPGAYDYAREHSISIRIDAGVCPEEVGRKVVQAALREFESAAGRKPSREEAITLVESVVNRILEEEV